MRLLAGSVLCCRLIADPYLRSTYCAAVRAYRAVKVKRLYNDLCRVCIQSLEFHGRITPTIQNITLMQTNAYGLADLRHTGR